MPHPDAPPIVTGADQLVDDMLSFLRGGRVPEPSGGESAADAADRTPTPADRDTTRNRERGS